jgi:hypothetical protein
LRFRDKSKRPIKAVILPEYPLPPARTCLIPRGFPYAPDCPGGIHEQYVGQPAFAPCAALSIPRPQSHATATEYPTMIDFETPLADRAQSAISSSPYLAGRQVWLETSDGRIVLQGVVGTFFQKQMAQEALRRVDGVRQIENNLEVAWS